MEKKIINLLLFHGSTNVNAIESAVNFTNNLCEQSGKIVKYCFLRVHQPSLGTALKSTVNDGFNKIRLIQLFLLPGLHVEQDIPHIINDFRQKHPEVEFEILPCLIKLDSFTSMLLNLLN